jgi:hypothetical protein
MPVRRLIAAALLVMLVPSGAQAAAVSASGWWKASALVVAADAHDALVVEGGAKADQPQSYAAAAFTLADGESPSRLLLAVAPGSVSTPGAALTVCALTGSFTPADGGAIADAPTFDCSAKATATAADGTYAFDLRSLGTTGTVAVAVLPGAASDRVVLAKPTSEALETTTAPAPEIGTTTLDGNALAGSDDSAGFSSTAPLATDSFDLPASDLPVTELPTAVDESTDATEDIRSPTDEAPVAVGPSTATSSDTSGGGLPLAPIAVAVLALLVAGLWTAAGRMADVRLS